MSTEARSVSAPPDHIATYTHLHDCDKSPSTWSRRPKGCSDTPIQCHTLIMTATRQREQLRTHHFRHAISTPYYVLQLQRRGDRRSENKRQRTTATHYDECKVTSRYPLLLDKRHFTLADTTSIQYDTASKGAHVPEHALPHPCEGTLLQSNFDQRLRTAGLRSSPRPAPA